MEKSGNTAINFKWVTLVTGSIPNVKGNMLRAVVQNYCLMQ